MREVQKERSLATSVKGQYNAKDNDDDRLTMSQDKNTLESKTKKEGIKVPEKEGNEGKGRKRR